MILTENELLLREGKKIVDALGRTLAPMVEVVLHDLSRPASSIVAISNNLSGRDVGDPTTDIGMARITNPDFPDVLQNYANQFPDGRPAKSTSIGLRNSAGEYVAALCLNVDVSMLASLSASLAQLARTESDAPPIRESLASPRLDELRAALEGFAARLNKTAHTLTPAQRRDAVQQLANAGLMDLKNAQAVVAAMLGVARPTVYSYLPQKDSSS
ncbi:PAS domain-containing protein [Massilia violaceinigra]|uniref:PAS domain-containing protein n=2 Tax=Massilia violaceinigra TaxID=2045208 RepID=A0ABY4AFV3_9BURK|nr:PAS domain-containing protein [Massilia violaceinigra]UOD33583.1 PAS domain-containing protein [Massilia violaceinigra]